MTPKNSHLFAEERRSQILTLLEKKHKLLVPELCEYFQASPATIRNDLRELSDLHLLKRTHGGALLIEQTTYEPTYNKKKKQRKDQKQEIANLALPYIQDGDTIALDTGTTTMALAQLLVTKKQLTVITNDLRIALFLEDNTEYNIIVLGGTLRNKQNCTVGPITLNTLDNLCIDKAFIATNAFSFERGFMTPDLTQSAVKQQLIKSSRKSFVLCDSSKIGTTSFVHFADLSDFHKFITDHSILQEDVQRFSEYSESTELVFDPT